MPKSRSHVNSSYKNAFADYDRLLVDTETSRKNFLHIGSNDVN
ncbi:MAG TPA: hypothetical protein VJ729_10845 [Nitrososphaeraceae archaeon]|nr:hypothetical protein [Nitrososphaeraceae archaeon]